MATQPLRRNLAKLLAGVTLLLSLTTAHAKLPPWQDTRTPQQWLAENEAGETRTAALDDLEKLLLDNLPKLPQQPGTDFFGWLGHLLWMRLSPDEPEKISTHEELAKHPAIVRSFLSHLRAADETKAAVAILHDLWQADSESVRRYPNMAVAFALVWDEPLGPNWVGHALPQDILKPGTETVPERFAFYVESAKQRRLENDPATLSVRELMFVIDTPLPLAELEWAQKNVRQSRSNFDRVYFTINYDHARFNNYLQSGNQRSSYLWSHPDYTLMTIKEKGGVCAEQAHFAVNAAQAKAIPAMYFGGKGADTLHAWMGYMERPGRWQLEVGRYASQNYPVGHALDPQTRTRISDDEIRLITTPPPRNARPGIEPALLRTWAVEKMTPEFRTGLRMLPDFDYYKDDGKNFILTQLSKADASHIHLLEMARTIDPDDIHTWRKETLILKHTSAALDTRRAQLEKRAQHFSRTNEFYTEALQELIPILRQLARTQEADKLQTELIRKNRRNRFDLGIDVGADSLLDKIDAEDWQAANQEFRKILRRFGEKGGGTLYYNLIEPYITALREAGQDALVKDSFDYIDRQMPITPGSQLYNDYMKFRGDDAHRRR